MYLANYNTYYNLVNETYSSNAVHFVVQFPNIELGPNEAVAIATNAAGFIEHFGKQVDFEIFGSDNTTPDMIDLKVGDNPSFNLTNEVKIGYDEVIGVSEYALTRSQGESPLNNLIWDAMIDATSADFSFTSFSGICSDLKAGPITPRDIFKVLPFGNSLVVLHMRGDFLKELIEGKIAGNRSGLAIGGGQVIYDREGTDGNKIKVFNIAGESIQADKVYRITTTDYLAEGNSGLEQLIELPESQVDQTGILLRDAVKQYVQKQSPLKIKMDGRWQK